jgi:hypothetical protein
VLTSAGDRAHPTLGARTLELARPRHGSVYHDERLEKNTADLFAGMSQRAFVTRTFSIATRR